MAGEGKISISLEDDARSDRTAHIARKNPPGAARARSRSVKTTLGCHSNGSSARRECPAATAAAAPRRHNISKAMMSAIAVDEADCAFLSLLFIHIHSHSRLVTTPGCSNDSNDDDAATWLPQSQQQAARRRRCSAVPRSATTPNCCDDSNSDDDARLPQQQ